MRSASRRVARAAVTAMAVIALGAGCRQANGPVPEPDAHRQEDLVDIGRDLMNVKGHDRSAPKEFSDDLAKYSEKPPVVSATRDLAQTVVTAVAGSKLTEGQAGELAQKLWVAVYANQLSQRQAKGVRDDIQTILKNAGAQQTAIDGVGDKVLAVQAAVTTNHKKWYEFF